MVIASSIGKEAVAFYKSGARSYLENTKLIVTDNMYFYNLIPAIVNLAFSIELAAKSFIDENRRPRGKEGHNLQLLVSLIEEPIQGVIIDAVMQVTKLDKEDVWRFLDKNKYAFVEWRYYYQDGKNVDISFLYEFATVMNNLVNNVNSKLQV